MKRVKKYLGLFLCLTLIISVPVATQAMNINRSSSKLEEKEKEIKDAEDAMKELEESLSDVKELVKDLESEKSSLKNYVLELDAALVVIEDKIADLELQITQKEADIADTQEQLEEAKTIEANQCEAMSSRIKYVYEKGSGSYIELLLQAKDVSDLLNRITYVEAITAYDKQKLDEYVANKEYINLCEEQLQMEKEHLDAMKVCVENEQEAVEVLIETKSQEIEAYENSIRNQEQAIKEYEAEIAEQNEIIKQLEEEKKKLLEESVIIYDGGMFAFPLESYTRISDDYGWRMHPILNVKQFHNGVDFAAPKGTKIYAAYDGVVVAATYSSSMGNYVMIDHGSGLYTIYMHASKLYVSKDEVVIKGQHIAGVGSTGRSTGNHLHFSVRKNGSYVSPWDYLSE